MIDNMGDFRALDPFFRIIEQGLAEFVDGDHFFDLLADDVVFDFIITVPNYPRHIVGRDDLIELYRGYGSTLFLDRCFDLRVHPSPSTSSVVLEYSSEGRVVATGQQVLSSHNNDKHSSTTPHRSGDPGAPTPDNYELRENLMTDEESTEVVSGPRSGVKYIAEAIGTFFLVFTVGAAVGSGSQFAPLAIGAVLMVMVYAGGHISGGHYNPAVTLSVLVRRRITVGDASLYWIVQLGAGLLAAAVVRWIVDPARATKTVTMTLTGHVLVAAFVVELLFTFALCYVVLNVATSKSHPDNSYFGLAIGFTVLAGAFAVGAISGGAFNPSVTVGAAVMGMFAWPTLWVYLVAQVIAGASAGVTFLALNPDDK